MTSPPSLQPKQYHKFLAGVTLKEGDFSSWKGHSPLSEPPPALRNWRYSPTTSAMGVRSRTSAMSSSLILPATVPQDSSPRRRSGRRGCAAGRDRAGGDPTLVVHVEGDREQQYESLDELLPVHAEADERHAVVEYT